MLLNTLKLAAFSADPNVQAPHNSQSYNRYSYVLNNPLKYMDPSGYSWLTKLRGVVKIVVGVVIVYYSGGNPIYGSAGLALIESGFNDLNGKNPNNIKANPVHITDFGPGSSSDSGSGEISFSDDRGDTEPVFGNEKYQNGTYSTSYIRMYDPIDSDVAKAELSRGVYDEKYSGNGDYKLVEKYSDETGLQAALFVYGSDAVLVFAGTNPTSAANWAANFSQAFGVESSQYTNGIKLAVRLKRNYKNLSFAGHSLGGGIAIASAAVTGGDAVVFNSADVHDATVGRLGASLSNASVRYYYSTTDLLRGLNAFTPGRIPGQHISLGSAGFHGMDGICMAMGCN